MQNIVVSDKKNRFRDYNNDDPQNETQSKAKIEYFNDLERSFTSQKDTSLSKNKITLMQKSSPGSPPVCYF